MPLYEYQCPKCGVFELIRKFSDEALTACPTCGRKIRKLASAPAFHLKGTGWYVTDYAKKSSGDSKSGQGKSDEGKSGDTRSGDGKSSESRSGDSGKGGGSGGAGAEGTKSAKDATASTPAATPKKPNN